jgi:hypothetical protein
VDGASNELIDCRHIEELAFTPEYLIKLFTCSPPLSLLAGGRSECFILTKFLGKSKKTLPGAGRQELAESPKYFGWRHYRAVLVWGS